MKEDWAYLGASGGQTFCLLRLLFGLPRQSSQLLQTKGFVMPLFATGWDGLRRQCGGCRVGDLASRWTLP